MQKVMFEQGYYSSLKGPCPFSHLLSITILRKTSWIALSFNFSYYFGNKLRKVIGPAQSHTAHDGFGHRPG